MEDKEQENGDKDVINITAKQLFGTPDKEFLINKNKNTEEEKGRDTAKKTPKKKHERHR